MFVGVFIYALISKQARRREKQNLDQFSYLLLLFVLLISVKKIMKRKKNYFLFVSLVFFSETSKVSHNKSVCKKSSLVSQTAANNKTKKPNKPNKIVFIYNAMPCHCHTLFLACFLSLSLIVLFILFPWF